jgi:hypothetical protein
LAFLFLFVLGATICGFFFEGGYFMNTVRFRHNSYFVDFLRNYYFQLCLNFNNYYKIKFWRFHTVRFELQTCHSMHLRKWQTRHTYAPLYTRSQGQWSTEIEHSYWCKSWNQLPKGFTLGVKAEIEKKLFNLPPTTNINAKLYGLVLAPKAEKRIPSNLRGQFATLGANVLAFMSNLGPIFNSKMLKLGPKIFGHNS